MLSELIMDLLECEHDPTEREKVYRKIEKAGVDRKTADLMAGEYRKSWAADKEKAEEEIRKKESEEVFINKCIEKADELGWIAHRHKDGIEFENWSPAGENLLCFARFPNIVKEVREHYECFDPDENVEMWLKAKSNSDNPNRNSIPSARTLSKDADDIDEMLSDFADALESVEEDFYGCDVCGLRFPWDDINWLTSSYGVCEHCYAKLTPEQIKELSEE